MLKIARNVLSIVTIFLALYGLITGNFTLQPFMIFCLSLFMLVTGLIEFKKEGKNYGWLFMIVFLFSLYVSIQTFLWNYQLV